MSNSQHRYTDSKSNFDTHTMTDRSNRRRRGRTDNTQEQGGAPNIVWTTVTTPWTPAESNNDPRKHFSPRQFQPLHRVYFRHIDLNDELLERYLGSSTSDMARAAARLKKVLQWKMFNSEEMRSIVWPWFVFYILRRKCVLTRSANKLWDIVIANDDEAAATATATATAIPQVQHQHHNITAAALPPP